MGSVTGFTAERMQAIENQAVVDGAVVGDDLVLTRHDGNLINAGSVRGAPGPPGPPGGLGEAPENGTTYGRKNAAWTAIPAAGVPEAPVVAGAAYARQNSAWAIAPGSLLGEAFNDADDTTALATPKAFGGGGTSITIAVGGRGVTVEFGVLLGHTGITTVYGVLLVDGALYSPKGRATGIIPVASGVIELSKTVTFPAGVLSVGNHVFEVKAQQATATPTLALYESHISIRSN